MKKQEKEKSLRELLDENRRKNFVYDPELERKLIEFREDYERRQAVLRDRMRNVKFPPPTGSII